MELTPLSQIETKKQSFRGLNIFAIVSSVLLVVTIAVWLIASSASRDDLTRQAKTIELASKIEDYARTKKKIPESFDEAGIKSAPSWIKYSVVKNVETNKSTYSYDLPEYKLCTTFLAKSAASDTSLGSFGTDIYNLSPISSGQSASPYGYSNIDEYAVSRHDKGEKCFTAKIYSISTSSYNTPSTTSPTVPIEDQTSFETDTKTVCSNKYSYKTSGYKWNAAPDGTKLKAGYTSTGSTYTYDAKTVKVFDSACKSIDISSIKVGSSVDLFETNNKIFIASFIQVK
jgi:hypothetical protein